jgi:hypothetical protein
MRHYFIARVFIIIAIAFPMTTAAIAQQSLGELAREARKNKPAEPTSKVITNEDLGAVTTSRTTEAEPTTANESSASNKTKPVKETSAADDQAKLDKEWSARFAAQNEAITLMERELEVLQRENKIRATTYYADAGSRLRDPAKYAEQDRKYRDQVDAKQKQIDAAKAKLEQMKEDARKAGVSPGSIG